MSGSAKPITFGPGSLETIRLERRVHNARRAPDAVQLQARVRGSFTVYCGMGNSHEVDMHGPWATVRYRSGARSTKGDTTADFSIADELAHELIADELEGWRDPCDTGDA